MAALVEDFRDVWDVPQWRMMAPAENASVAGCSWACDLRPTSDRHPFIYQFASAAILNAYSPKDDEHMAVINPATGTFGAGCGMVFAPSIGPSGTLSGAGSTVTINTVEYVLLPLAALPNSGSIGLNQWGNRGDFTQDNGGIYGFKIRVYDNGAGGSGKLLEGYVVGNSAGTTPTLTVLPTTNGGGAAAFAPVSGSKWELISGSLMMMATGAPEWRRYDIALNLMITLTSTNLVSPATDSAMFVIDETYVPNGMAPGLGFFNAQLPITAVTNTTNATITGTSGQPDASQPANSWANFQLRIVSDTGTPAAAGQRMQITAHTNANPTVYTLKGIFATAPSTSAKYVIEGIGDVVVFTGASTTSCTYGGNFAADAAFSTNATLAGGKLQIPVRAANTAAGTTAWWAFGDSALDPEKNARYSACYLIRGGAVSTIDCYDIAANSWTTGVGGQAIVYGGVGLTTFTTGTCSCQNPWSQMGQFTYINVSGTQRFLRWDNQNRILTPYAYLRMPQGTAVVGEKLMCTAYIDSTGTPMVGALVHNLNTGTQMAQLFTSR